MVQIFKKISIFAKIWKIRFSQISETISFLVKILGKFWDLAKKSIFRKNFDFGKNIRRNSIFLKISKNFDFGQIFKKISFLVKIFEISKNFDFDQIFEKISFLVKLFEISKNFDFGKIFEKISIWVKFSERFRF